MVLDSMMIIIRIRADPQVVTDLPPDLPTIAQAVIVTLAPQDHPAHMVTLLTAHHHILPPLRSLHTVPVPMVQPALEDPLIHSLADYPPSVAKAAPLMAHTEKLQFSRSQPPDPTALLPMVIIPLPMVVPNPQDMVHLTAPSLSNLMALLLMDLHPMALPRSLAHMDPHLMEETPTTEMTATAASQPLHTENPPTVAPPMALTLMPRSPTHTATPSHLPTAALAMIKKMTTLLGVRLLTNNLLLSPLQPRISTLAGVAPLPTLHLRRLLHPHMVATSPRDMLLLRLLTRAVDMISTRSRVRKIITHGDLLTVMIPQISTRIEFMTVITHMISWTNNFTTATPLLISTRTSLTKLTRPTATSLTKDPLTRTTLTTVISPASREALPINPPATLPLPLSHRTHSVQATDLATKTFLISLNLPASPDLAHTNIRPPRLPLTKLKDTVLVSSKLRLILKLEEK